MSGIPTTYRIFALPTSENFCWDRCLYHKATMKLFGVLFSQRSMIKLPLIRIVLLVFAANFSTVYPQTVDSVGSSTLSNIEFSVTNNGIIAYNPSARTGNFIAPRGGQTQYLFGGGLWFGAQHIVGDTVQHLLFSTYNPVTNRSAATPGDAFTNDTAAPPIVYHSTDYDRWSGRPANGNSNAPNWPLWLFPSQQTSLPLFPGLFEPINNRRVNGEYGNPAFMGLADEQFTVRYHDGDLSRYEISTAAATERGYPIGLQIQQNVYGWKFGPLKNSVVVQYAVTNISNQTLSECVIAQISDPDIGQHRDNDHAIFYARDFALRACYAWSDAEPEGSLGALAMVLLEAPTILPNTAIDTTNRPQYRNMGRVGCFTTWRRSDSIPYPITDVERATLLHKQSFEPDTSAGDQVVLLGSSPFTMKPGDVAHFAVAYVVLDSVPNRTATGAPNGTTAMGAVPELEELVREAEEVYYRQPVVVSSTGLSQREVTTMQVFPNPAATIATVRFTLPIPSVVVLRVFNSLGERVVEQNFGTFAAGLHTLPLTELPTGAYLLELNAGKEQHIQSLIVE